MACYHPLSAFKLGGQIHFGAPSSSLVQPLKLPCGQCIGCRLERSRQWATRIMFESQFHEENCFITLTYRDEDLPYPPSLDYRHFQLFMKRLRKQLGHKVRFYACGEYGDEYFRPHFHACLFGVDFYSDRYFFNYSPSGKPLYRSPLLERCWTAGHSSIGDLTFESAAYVARYVTKKITGDVAPDYYQFVDSQTGEVFQLKPEFARMSLKPGIGGAWFDKYSSDVYKDHDYVIVRGRQCRPPRYFDRLLERVDPARFEEVKADRVKKAEKYAANNTADRLAVREEVQLAALGQLSPRNDL